MKAHAIALEKSFVVARRRERRVLERKHRDHFARAAWITNSDRPWTTAPIADDVRVTSRGNDAVLDAMASENGRTVVDGVSLREASQIDARAGVCEAHGASLRIEHQVLIADRGACRGELRVARLDAFAIVVKLTDTGERDVECAVRHARERNRALYQREHFLRQCHGPLRGLAIDA